MDDLIAFISARLDEDEAAARQLLRTAQNAGFALEDPRLLGTRIPGWHSWPDVEAMCARALCEVAAKRLILAEYQRVAGSARAYPNSASVTSLGTAQTMLKALGTVWSDHADHRQEWAVYA